MEFKERVIAIRKLGAASSSDLYAGSPMIYQCEICDGIADRRPESFDPRNYGKPNRICDACADYMGISGKDADQLKAEAREVQQGIPYKRAEIRNEKDSWSWLFAMGALSRPE